MNRSNASQQIHSERGSKLVIATGCPGSGWERVLGILAQSGVELVGEKLSPWLDWVYRLSGEANPLAVRETLQIHKGMWEEAQAGLVETSAITCLADSRHTWLLQFWATRLPQAQFLLFYTNPSSGLANALQLGIDAAYFLDGWQAINREFLYFLRRHRDRVLLLDADAAINNPEAFITTCNRSGLGLRIVSEGTAPVLDDLSLERLLAGHLMVGFPHAQALHLELDASALPLGEVASEFPAEDKSLEELYQKRRQIHKNLEIAYRELESSHKAIIQENELLLFHFHHVQEETERYLQRTQSLEGVNHASKKQIDELRRELTELKTTFLGKIAAYIYDKRKRFRRARKMKASVKKELAIIKSSELFNESWYLVQYPDVAEACVNPVLHYLKHGVVECRNPSPNFDTCYYLHANPDVAADGINPFVHYITLGKYEGRQPHRPG